MVVSWIRFVKSIGVVALLCALSIALIFVVWEFAVGPTTQNAFILKYIINPDMLDDPETNEYYVGQLSKMCQLATLSQFGNIFIFSVIWLAVANFVHINKPGDGNTWIWVWIMVFLVGAAVSAIIPIYIFQEEADGLMRGERVIPFVIIFIIVFSAFYYFIGSLLATPKHMVTAIPLATKILFR